MFTRTELEIKTIAELVQLCKLYGLKPTGNKGYKQSYLVTLLAFHAIAVNQLQQGRGIKPPSFGFMNDLSDCVDSMGTPTDEQSALIKMTMEGKTLNYPDRYSQEKLLALYKAKYHLELALGLLSQ
jgi:hypothetical protein